MTRRLLFLVGALAGAAQAQFQLFSVTGTVETPVAAVFDFGTAGPGDAVSVRFRVRNTSSAPAALVSMVLAGSGFTFPTSPGLPKTLAPAGTLDFTVQFQANAAGSYSAGMTLPGISVILTAAVVSELTYSAGSPIDFGQVVHGTSATLNVVVSNRSTAALAIPSFTVFGAGFSVDAPSPAGLVLQPQQSDPFTLRFAPSSNGSYSGTLIAGDRTFVLSGTGVDPRTLAVSVNPGQLASGAQGTAVVSLNLPALTAASGTLTLDFQGAADPAVAFASGGRSVAFTVSPGDTQLVSVPFQAGTTAGTIVFTATLGSASAQQSVTIAPAVVALSSATALRASGALTVEITGFDNTRSAGSLAFTFYDGAGNAIPPSPIQASADFTDFFQTSGLGGLFLLKAVFPVNGDPAQVAAFEVQMTNAAGSSSTGRTNF